MKRCPMCKITKESQFFSIERRTKDGLCCYCKDCKKVIRKNRLHKSKPVAKQRLQNMTSGVYTITNLKENKIYVGQSIMIEQRRTQHFTDLRGKRHPNKQLQEDFNRLGEEEFEHQIYQEVDKDDVLLVKLKELETMLKFRNDGWSLYNSEEK